MQAGRQALKKKRLLVASSTTLHDDISLIISKFQSIKSNQIKSNNARAISISISLM